MLFVFVADTRKPMCVSCVNCYLEFAAKQYCTDHQTANAIQLIDVS